jgi:hypothetical protein
MIVIAILLGGLWYKERVRANQLQLELAAARQVGRGVIANDEQLQQFLQRVSREAQSRPVNRSALASQPVRLDDRQVQALRLPAEDGRRLGFRSGDVIVVDESPATQSSPATLPASMPARQAAD